MSSKWWLECNVEKNLRKEFGCLKNIRVQKEEFDNFSFHSVVLFISCTTNPFSLLSIRSIPTISPNTASFALMHMSSSSLVISQVSAEPPRCVFVFQFLKHSIYKNKHSSFSSYQCGTQTDKIPHRIFSSKM